MLNTIHKLFHLRFFKAAALCATWFLMVYASLLNLAQAADTPRPATEVFKPELHATDATHFSLRIHFPAGYYLYRDRFFSLTPMTNGVTLVSSTPLPTETITDAYFGKQAIWQNGEAGADFVFAYNGDASQLQFNLRYQGCQKEVVCYPPQSQDLILTRVSTQDNKNEATEDPETEAAIAAMTGQVSLNTPKITTQVSRLEPAKMGIQLQPSSDNPHYVETKVLSEDEAFAVEVFLVDPQHAEIFIAIAPHHYLYRDKTKLLPSLAGQTGQLIVPDGELHQDAYFGEQAILKETPVMRLTLDTPLDTATRDFLFSYQGCAEEGICYPVMYKRLSLSRAGVQVSSWLPTEAEKATLAPYQNAISLITESAQQQAANTASQVSSNAQNKLTKPAENTVEDSTSNLNAIITAHFWLGLLVIFASGVLLSFTPCVLPMLPILLGIITNQKRLSRKKSALLSSSYALGVAVMMAVFGLVVTQTGINLQIIFQKPLWLILFATLFIVMGLAMLGLFRVAMPNGVQTRVVQLQNRLQDAKPFNLFLVGALSTLVVGPCIAPPLVSILAFISTTGNSLWGALYLFTLGLGMSLPLVVFASFTTTIPKTGAASILITRFFAWLMFAVALWLLGRLLSGAISLLLWGVMLLVLAYLGFKNQLQKLWLRRSLQTASAAITLLALLWIIGGALGHSNPFKPLTAEKQLPFVAVHSTAELTQALNGQQLVLLDLYADWCASCQEVEHLTLADPKVQAAVENVTLIKLDITDLTADKKALMQSLNLIGPPAMLFFKNGQELEQERVIGVVKPKPLLEKLARLQATR